MLNQEARAEIIAIARRDAHDYYLSALLAPPEARDDLLVLAAFEGEISRIIATVAEPVLAEIRLQWWRDAVAAMDGTNQSGHPVADALSKLVFAGRVSATSLQRSIDARSADTGAEPIATKDDLESYLDRTDAEALARAVHVVSALPASPAPQPALVRSAGHSVGLTRILLDLPYRRATGRVLLPDLAAVAPTATRERNRDADITQESARLLAQCRKIAGQADVQLGQVRVGWTQMPRGHRAALGPVALVGPYLRGLQRVGCLAPRPGDVISPVSRIGRLWWAVRFARL